MAYGFEIWSRPPMRYQSGPGEWKTQTEEEWKIWLDGEDVTSWATRERVAAQLRTFIADAQATLDALACGQTGYVHPDAAHADALYQISELGHLTGYPPPVLD